MGGRTWGGCSPGEGRASPGRTLSVGTCSVRRTVTERDAGLAAPGLDMDQGECDALVAYVRGLPPPIAPEPAGAAQAARVGAGGAGGEREAPPRRAPVTGVSEFPDLHEKPVPRSGPDLLAGLGLGCGGLPVHRPAAAYEELRDRSDALLAGVRARLRDDRSEEATMLRAGDVALDLRTRRANVAGRSVELTAREFAVLAALSAAILAVAGWRMKLLVREAAG